MNTEFLPSILAHTEDEFRRKVEAVKPLGLMLHIDIMDGKFVENTSWGRPESVKKVVGSLSYEVHLMVENPEEAVPVWMKSEAKRIFFHAEACHNPTLLTQDVDMGRIGVALSPRTSLDDATPYLDAMRMVMLLGVQPGRSGQKFDASVLKKIAALRREYPSIRIHVDGGVTAGNCATICTAGARGLVCASALTDAKDPTAALAGLKKLCP